MATSRQKEVPKWVDHTEVEIAKIREAGDTERHRISLRYSLLRSDWVQLCLGLVVTGTMLTLLYILYLWGKHTFHG